MKHPTTTFLVYLFPLLAPTLAFAHARPHPHPHAAENGEGSELSQARKLKRQIPVANDTIILPDETTSSKPPVSTTSKSVIDLDDILSSIQTGVLGGDPTTTSESSSVPTSDSTTSQNSTDTADSTTTSSDDITTTDAPETTLDLSLPTILPIATLTSGLTTGLNTPSITVQPPIPVDTSTASPDEDTTSTKGRPQIPIIETLSDILTSLLPDEDKPTKTTSSDTASITDDPEPTSTGLDDILSSILSDLTSVIDITSSLTTDIDITSTPTTESTDLPTIEPTIIPTDTGVVIPTDLPTNTTADPTGIITTLPPTDSPTTPLDPITPPEPTTITTDSALTTNTGLPGSTDLPVNNTTAIVPTDIPTASLPLETTGTGSTLPTGSSVIPSNVVTGGPSQTNIEASRPTANGDDDTSSMWFGTSLVTQPFQQRPTGTDAGAATGTALPSGVPEAITPPGGVPTEPDNSTLIQIGFTRDYNYAFVSDSPESAAQICYFLPKGLAGGLGLANDEIRMHTLQPLQPDGLDYIVTLGLVYIPADIFLKLQSDIHIPLSGLYTQKDPNIRKFMNTIDPSIPLIPGQNIALMPHSNSDGSGGGSEDADWIKDGDNLVDGSQSTSTSGADSGGGADPYGTDGSSNPITSKQVTIGVASVGAAALYGVAMYFLAKRYRNNRISHRRSQSLSGGGIEPPPMSDIRSSGALSPLMSTHFFNNGRVTPAASDKRGSKGSKTSARGQISAPMMSENSLGWD